MAFSHLASFHGLLSPCILPWPSHTLRPHDLPRFPPPSCVHCPNDIFLEDDHRTCSDHGVCIDGVSCRCDEAWEGATCNLLRCTGPVDGCNDHGDCQNDLAPAPCTVTADGNLTDAAEGLCSNLLDDCIAAYHDCPQRGVSNQVCDLPRSPAFSRLLPPSPAFSRLLPPSLTCSSSSCAPIRLTRAASSSARRTSAALDPPTLWAATAHCACPRCLPVVACLLTQPVGGSTPRPPAGRSTIKSSMPSASAATRGAVTTARCRRCRRRRSSHGPTRTRIWSWGLSLLRPPRVGGGGAWRGSTRRRLR